MATRIIAPLIIVLFSCNPSFAQSGKRAGSSSLTTGGSEGGRQVGQGAKVSGKAAENTVNKMGKATGRAVTTGARRTGKAVKSVGVKTSDADGRIGD